LADMARVVIAKSVLADMARVVLTKRY
jgi:hypothetical protein